MLVQLIQVLALFFNLLLESKEPVFSPRLDKSPRRSLGLLAVNAAREGGVNYFSCSFWWM